MEQPSYDISPEQYIALLQASLGDEKAAPGNDAIRESAVQADDLMPGMAQAKGVWGALKGAKALPLLMAGMKSPHMEELLGKEFWKAGGWKKLRQYVTEREERARGLPTRRLSPTHETGLLLPGAAAKDLYGSKKDIPLESIARDWELFTGIAPPNIKVTEDMTSPESVHNSALGWFRRGGARHDPLIKIRKGLPNDLSIATLLHELGHAKDVEKFPLHQSMPYGGVSRSGLERIGLPMNTASIDMNSMDWKSTVALGHHAVPPAYDVDAPMWTILKKAKDAGEDIHPDFVNTYPSLVEPELPKYPLW